MSPERFARIQEIFGEALEYHGSDHDVFVAQAAGNSDSLRDEVLSLLRAHDRSEAFLDRPVIPAGALREVAFAERSFVPGQIVSGRFRIQSFLGEGGMGEVYAAEDLELHTRVALKTLHPHLAASPKFAERFRKEVHVARQVTHPNVCRIFDAGRYEATLYLTMELLEGDTLARRLEVDGQLPLTEATLILQQLCAGLSAAHRAGVLHRDFKSANIMLAGSRAVIMDFGLARLLDRGDEAGSMTTGVAIGTPSYMAPEQFARRSIGPAADIYALGVVMHEMVTGKRPFESVSPADVPGAWKDTIQRCLATEPADRFQDADLVFAAIDSSRPAGIRLRLRPKRLFAIFAACVMLLAGGVGIRGLVVPPHATQSDEAIRWYNQGVDAFTEGSFLKASNLLQRAISFDSDYVPAHARLAEAYAELDMYDKAKDQIIRAVTIAPDRSKLPSSDARLLEAAEFSVSREFGKAAEVYRSIAEAAIPANVGGTQLDLGRAAEKANSTNKAIEAYTRAAASSVKREAALLNLGRLYGRLGKRSEAANQLHEAEKLFQLASNHEGVTESKLALARLLESSDLQRAEALSRSAIEIARLTGNQQQQVKARFELGRVKLLEGHAGEANAIADEAISMAQRLHLDNLSVEGLNDLAGILSRQRRWTEVEALCLRAVELAIRSKSRAGEARAFFYLGQARANLGDHDAAARYLNQAAPFYRQGGDSLPLQDLLALKSGILCLQGRYAEAKTDAIEMEQWATKRGNSQVLILALQRRAEPLVFEGDYAAALELYMRQTKLQRQSGRLAGVAYALINQGDMLWRLGRYAESSAQLAQAQLLLVQLGDAGRGPLERLQLVQAQSLLSQGRAEQAQRKARSALESAKGGSALTILEAQSVLARALVHRRQPTPARELCQRSLDLAKEAGGPIGTSLAMLARAEIAAKTRDAQTGRFAADAAQHCRRYGHAELRLRALLLEWNFHRHSRSIAAVGQAEEAFHNQLQELKARWGSEQAAMYMQRPDISALLPEKR